MRTTVDLPPAVHQRALEIARRSGRSLSAVVADLTVRGLDQFDEPVVIGTDEQSGFPVITIGGRITSDQVAAALDAGRGVTTYLLDANAVIALTVADHEHRARTSAWASGITRFAVCPVVEGALVAYWSGSGRVLSSRSRWSTTPGLRVLAGLTVPRCVGPRSCPRASSGRRRPPRERGREPSRRGGGDTPRRAGAVAARTDAGGS